MQILGGNRYAFLYAIPKPQFRPLVDIRQIISAYVDLGKREITSFSAIRFYAFCSLDASGSFSTNP